MSGLLLNRCCCLAYVCVMMCAIVHDVLTWMWCCTRVIYSCYLSVESMPCMSNVMSQWPVKWQKPNQLETNTVQFLIDSAVISLLAIIWFLQQFETAALDGCKLKKSTNTERTRYNKSNDVKVLHLVTNSKSELTYRVGTQRDIRHKLFEIKIERRANFNKKVCSASLIERAAICSFSMRNPNIHLCAIIYI